MPVGEGDDLKWVPVFESVDEEKVLRLCALFGPGMRCEPKHE